MFFDPLSRSPHSAIMRRRINYIGVVVLILAVVVFGRYYSLQITHNAQYTTLSDQNSLHVRPVSPVRGTIVDRNGVLLAHNVPIHVLNIIPERSDNISALIEQLSNIIDISEREIDDFYNRLERLKQIPHQGIPLKYRLTEEEVARLAVNEYRLAGAEVKATLARDYPLLDAMAHPIGYVGYLSREESQNIDKNLYEGIHLIGKIGIEKQYETTLLGRIGQETVETGVAGRVHRIISRTPAIPGQSVQLHIDANLQQLIHNQLSGQRGAAVAIDIKSGGILAMVSQPAYNPNPFVKGMTQPQLDVILSNRDKPLLNRTLLGQYPPGSIIKPTFALMALDTNSMTADEIIEDKGFIVLPNNPRRYRDWKRDGHGDVNMARAIIESCDIFFYELGLRTGIDLLKEYANLFGLGVSTGIDMPQEENGWIPSPATKKWSEGETVNTSIGQGDVLVTPLQMVQNTATLARKGTVLPPRMVKSIGDKELINHPINHIPIDDSHWQVIHQSMQKVVAHYQGTAHLLARRTQYTVAAKTGTAQVVSIDQDAEYNSEELKIRQRDHAWFTAFAPVQNPKIAIVVLVENGESSAASAGVIAIDAINYWLTNNG